MNDVLEKHVLGLKLHAQLVKDGHDPKEASELVFANFPALPLSDSIRIQQKNISKELDELIPILLSEMPPNRFDDLLGALDGITFQNPQDNNDCTIQRVYKGSERGLWQFNLEYIDGTGTVTGYLIDEFGLEDKLGILDAIEQVLL